jgi:hypothetical protein
MTVDAFWIDGDKQHCSVFVLGLFCSILHGSTLKRKGWTNLHHPQPGFCFCTCAGWVREGR